MMVSGILRRGVAAVALVLCISARAQSPMAGHDMGTMKEIPAPEKLPAPLKMTGLGNSHITITGTPEAQMWFDQGLNELHDFWDYEAARSFEQAVRVDPNCAMCSWGLYQALGFRGGPFTIYMQSALDNAARLKNKARKPEKLYIEAALAARAAEKAAGDGRPNDKPETDILRKLVKDNPKDLQAKIFLAGAVRDGYTDAGEPKKGTLEAIALYQEVLKAAPNDSAANHYWIHAMEPSSHPERALESSALLASLSPASGHMVHMPGHIFYRVGDYAQAEHWFAASTQVDETYMQTQNVSVDDDWNYIHNLMYGIANYMEEGKLQQATTLSAKAPNGRGTTSATMYTGSPRDGISRLSPTLPIALRTGDWAAITTMLADAKPSEKLPNLNFLAGALRDFALGMTNIQSGNLAEAQAASTRLDAELWRLTQTVKDAPKPKKDDTKGPPTLAVMPDAQPAPLLSNLAIMSLELRGAILAQQAKLPEAKALFAQAALEEKKLGYREPPSYIRPVGEAEGAALLRANDNAGAHKAYEAALVERPKSGFPLYGMARSSEAAGDTAKARAEYTQFLAAWKNGDTTAPELAHANQYMAEPKTVASTK